jgi:hypothetical protein
MERETWFLTPGFERTEARTNRELAYAEAKLGFSPKEISLEALYQTLYGAAILMQNDGTRTQNSELLARSQDLFALVRTITQLPLRIISEEKVAKSILGKVSQNV